MDKRKKAVTLKYDPLNDQAPRITAKGAGLIAERIIELARKEGIPIQEDPDLVGDDVMVKGCSSFGTFADTGVIKANWPGMWSKIWPAWG